MSKFRLTTGLIVIIVFSFLSLCMAEEGPDGATGASSSMVEVLKTVGIVKMIKGDTLYLENNQKYNLSNAQVKYDPGQPKPGKKRKAQMYFVNDVLKEVTIYY